MGPYRTAPSVLCGGGGEACMVAGYCWEDIINSVVDKLAKQYGYLDPDLRGRFDWLLDVWWHHFLRMVYCKGLNS